MASEGWEVLVSVQEGGRGEVFVRGVRARSVTWSLFSHFFMLSALSKHVSNQNVAALGYFPLAPFQLPFTTLNPFL